MSNHVKSIGERIRRARKKKNLSQAQLAEILDLSTSHVSDIELGKTNCSLSIFANIVDALDVSSDWLIDADTLLGKEYRRKELNDVLDGCTSAETEIILKTLQSLKAALISAREHVN